jgi:hypothetical protein
MRWTRFSILGLLAATTWVGLGCYALVNATPLWASLWMGLDLLGLSIAVLCAIHRTGERRASWLGASLFGWVYFVAMHLPGAVSEPFTSHEHLQLPTTRLLLWMYRDVLPLVREPPVPQNAPGGSAGGGFFNLQVDADSDFVMDGVLAPGPLAQGGFAVNPFLLYPAQHVFVRVGHLLLVAPWALLGAVLSCWLYSRRPPAE